MKNFWLGGLVALALAVVSGETSKTHAAGGGGWSIGLRLSGDASWYGWRACNTCNNGASTPAMWPMGGPAMPPMGWGYPPHPAPMPYPIGGFGPPMPMPMPYPGVYPGPFGY